MRKASGNNKKQEKNVAGLPKRGEPVFLALGILRKPHGIKGEMFLEVLTDFPERLKKGKRIYLGEKHIPHNITSVRTSGNGLLVQLDNIENREEAAMQQKEIIYVKSDEIPELDKDVFYHHQIIGLLVVDVDQKRIGRMVDILKTGSNDIYVIDTGDEANREILLPAIQSVIVKIDLENERMIVNPPEWG